MESIKEMQVRGLDVVDFLSVTSDLEGLCAIEMDCVMARRQLIPASRLVGDGPVSRVLNLLRKI
jgi:hypothetical protein